MKSKITCNKVFDKKQIAKLIEWFIYNYGSIRTNKLVNKIKSIGFEFSTLAGLSLGMDDLKIPTIKKSIITNTIRNIEKKEKKYSLGKINKIDLVRKEIEIWNITNNNLKNEIIKNFRQTDLLNPVYMMIFSGARGNLAQIKQLIGMRGLMSDSNGEILNLPIKANLKEGLNNKEYFISCYGARKGIIDTALKTANSGYLTRKLIYVSQNLIIKQQDCKTKNGTLIKLKAENKFKYTKLKSKLIGNIIAENIKIKTEKRTICKGQDICPYIAKKLIENESYIYLRSVLSCRINTGLCQLCYGWNLANNKIVKIGEAIGVLAAQSIGEPGTQLTMRTFHTGGVFNSEINKVINSPSKGIIYYNEKTNGKKSKNKFGENIFFTAKEKKVFIRKNNQSIFQLVLPKNSTIFLKTKQKVFKKQIIGEISNWQEKNRLEKLKKEIKNHNIGQVYKNGKSLWILNGFLFKNNELTKKLKLKERKEVLKIKEQKQKKIEKQTNIFLSHLNYKILEKITKKTIKKPIKKIYEIITVQKEDKKIIISKDKNKLKLKITSKSKNNHIGNFLTKEKAQIVKKGIKSIELKKGTRYNIPEKSKTKINTKEIVEKNTTLYKIQYEKEKTQDIIEGLPKIEEILEIKKTRGLKIIKNNSHDRVKKIFENYKKSYSNKIANRKSIKKIQKVLLKQIQKVYNSQNVNIAEKHIAIIIRQITSKVIIRKKGNSNLMEGEIMDLTKIEKINKFLKSEVKYEPILLGISRMSLLNESFISAACFQETVKILNKSAISGRIDWLTGLKENIILGNLIPAGTGRNSATID